MKPVTGQQRIRVQRTVFVDIRDRMPPGRLLVNTAGECSQAGPLRAPVSLACSEVVTPTSEAIIVRMVTRQELAAVPVSVTRDWIVLGRGGFAQHAAGGGARPVGVGLILLPQECDTPRGHIGGSVSQGAFARTPMRQQQPRVAPGIGHQHLVSEPLA